MRVLEEEPPTLNLWVEGDMDVRDNMDDMVVLDKQRPDKVQSAARTV